MGTYSLQLYIRSDINNQFMKKRRIMNNIELIGEEVKEEEKNNNIGQEEEE